MDVNQTKSLLYWNYFLSLESELGELSRYVEFSESNFSTYSIEMSRLFLSTASEVDVVAKKLCTRHDAKSKASNITKYCDALQAVYPGINQMKVTIPRYGLTLTPWENWTNENSPQWWSDHNNVKHNRSDYFHAANLKNVLNAMAGLLLLVMLFYKGQTEKPWIAPVPILLKAPETLAKQSLVVGVGHPVIYFTEI